ncbi:MAG: hypothetical protein BWX71_02841 [Deltaproteobacteria bacterium ADurb.Bin072]|nr:MAG: hypothetical protein BWX71_02841 [Deltaproteobacteria bacterium ADurb.Bin072]
MMRVRCTVVSKTGRWRKPGAITVTRTGAAISPISTMTVSATNMRVRTSRAMRYACSTPSRSFTSLKTGTKATLTAPSAMNRLSRFGSLKATTKASARGPAPSSQAMTMSRTKPRTRLMAVRPPTVATFFRKPSLMSAEVVRIQLGQSHSVNHPRPMPSPGLFSP